MDLTPCQTNLPMLNDHTSVQEGTRLDATRTRLAAASQEQHIDMELVTAEGDRVTLSLESQSRALAVSSAAVHAGTGQLSLSKSELFASKQERSMTLTVEGDLNEQEKKDLDNVLKTLTKMMTHFVNDRLGPMLSKAKQLGKLETVSGLAVEMSYSRQVLVAEQDRVDTTYSRQGALEQPSPAQPPAERLSRPEDNWRAVLLEAEALTDTMTEQIKQARVFVERMQGRIRDMFDRFRDRVAAWDPADPAGPELINSMHEKVMAKALARDV